MKYTLKAILVMALGCLTYSCLDLDPKDQIAVVTTGKRHPISNCLPISFIGWTRDSRTACTMRLIRTSVRT